MVPFLSFYSVLLGYGHAEHITISRMVWRAEFPSAQYLLVRFDCFKVDFNVLIFRPSDMEPPMPILPRVLLFVIRFRVSGAWNLELGTESVAVVKLNAILRLLPVCCCQSQLRCKTFRK